MENFGKPFSSKKAINENNRCGKIITDDKSVAKVFNDYFSLIIKHLYLERNEFDPKHMNLRNNPIFSTVNKLQNHPSIFKIRSNRTYSGFNYRTANYKEVLKELKKVEGRNSIGRNYYNVF